MDSLNINQKAIAWLNSAKGVSNGKIGKILEYFGGSTLDLWENFEKEKSRLKLGDEIISSLSMARDGFEEMFLKRMNREKVRAVTLFDEDYPHKLKETAGAPFILYYKGKLDEINNISIAVVGSRKATGYGKWASEKFTGELSQLGVNIVSGLAYGIDAVAHKTALKCGALTFGVIACGIDVVYPRANEGLYREIEEKGAVITEYTFGMQPMPNNFHDRNRIISGLSDGVLVVEAQERSGTLITAGHAADQGREIFAVPGNIDSLYSKGTNALIRDGAKITTCIDDIIEEIAELKEKLAQNKKTKDFSSLSDDEMKIITCLSSGEKSLYELSVQTGLDIPLMLGILTFLEMKCFVCQMTGNRFRLS